MPYAMLVSDPLASTLILLALLWVAAKIGGELAARLKLPAVAGQLLMGVVLAILPKVFCGFPNVAKSDGAHLISYIGIILLMFMVGLESSVPQMLKVGWASLRVAVVGVIVPMALGLMAAYFLLPPETPYAVDLFIGACLCATSIGISVQVLRERHEADSQAGRVIIGAAVIDDVLGLLVLVAVSGLAVATTTAGGALPWGELGKTLGLALLFLALALTAGRWLSAKIFQFLSRLKSAELLSPLALAFAFTMAYLGNLVGLATIVGAYAAGLIVEHSHVESLQKREGRSLEEMIQQVVIIFAPLFFVYTAATIDPS
ncbi:MAG: cation:proton antiporter, partial [Holophagales bacterium]|nr:cation:proton antiporter [Holophagales bacterium]